MKNVYKMYAFEGKNIFSKTTILILLFRVLYPLLLECGRGELFEK